MEFFDQIEAMYQALPPTPPRGAEPATASTTAEAAAAKLPSSYLEQDRKGVTSKRDVISHEARVCGCKSFFCERCCLSKGIALKQRLKPVLATFKGVMMLTFTNDPQLFEGPRDAFDYVKKNRCIARTMQQLDRWKLLHSRRYLVVVEWQENGWSHWHVVVDASYIPFDKLAEAWNKNWKGWEERVALGRPGFGSVRFTAEKLDRDRAAGYVTAYLTKPPKHAYPDWVMNANTRAVRRFEPSRGLWKHEEQSGESDEDGADGTDDNEAERPDGENGHEVRKTIAEQVSECGLRTVVLEVQHRIDESTGEELTCRRFVARAEMPLSEFMKLYPPLSLNKRETVASYDSIPCLKWNLAPPGRVIVDENEVSADTSHSDFMFHVEQTRRHDGGEEQESETDDGSGNARSLERADENLQGPDGGTGIGDRGAGAWEAVRLARAEIDSLGADV